MMPSLGADLVNDALIERRRFVACVASAAALVLSGCASLATNRVTPIDGVIRLRLSDYPELTQPDGALRVQPEGYRDPLLVLAVPDEDGAQSGQPAFSALSPRCTHKGCTVDVEGRNLVCPCHGSTYDRRGKVLRGPAERSLSAAPVVLVDGVLEIRLGGAP